MKQISLPISIRRGDYGFDAPYVPIILGLIGLVFLAIGILCLFIFPTPIIGIIGLIYAVFFLLSTAIYIYATRLGKFQVWAEILAQLNLQGEEQILDMGCGRGAVLLMAASSLSIGKAIGIDLWISRDQSGNAMEVTQRNAELEGVAKHIELLTADMREVPFPEESFDVVLSSLAIHNIPDPDGRKKAIDEAVRVLKPGGRLAIADFRSTKLYVERLQELGMLEIQHNVLGWRSWFGGPWGAIKLVSARKYGRPQGFAPTG